MTEAIRLKAKDFKSGVKPIWCPGCGHFSVFNAITKAMAAQGISKDDTVMVSGIGCSSRLPAYVASKFALRGMTECWREELRRHDVRVILINPSEVLTDFSRHAGYSQEHSDKKLRPQEIADAVIGVLEMDERGFVPELAVFATNPF